MCAITISLELVKRAICRWRYTNIFIPSEQYKSYFSSQVVISVFRVFNHASLPIPTQQMSIPPKHREERRYISHFWLTNRLIDSCFCPVSSVLLVKIEEMFFLLSKIDSSTRSSISLLPIFSRTWNIDYPRYVPYIHFKYSVFKPT